MAAAHPRRALRCRAGNAGARARRALHRMRARTKWARRSASISTRAGPQFRGLYQDRRHREEDPARRLREGRCLVPHRRSDAARRAMAISISSTASATPSAGRARMSPPAKWPRRCRRVPGIQEANVYGVTVPGADGRAGMAALVVDGDFDHRRRWRRGWRPAARLCAAGLPAAAAAKWKSPAPSSSARWIW